jgi:hypothetical protein
MLHARHIGGRKDVSILRFRATAEEEILDQIMTFRISGELRVELEKNAILHGITLSEEIRQRLEMSFLRPESPALAAV